MTIEGNISVEVEMAIPVQRIGDLLCNAFEGGSTYWCTVFSKGERPQGAKYLHEYPLFPDGWVKLGDSQDPSGARTLNAVALKQGLEVMHRKFPRHFADFLEENDDAETGDVFLRCCLFGDVVFV